MKGEVSEHVLYIFSAIFFRFLELPSSLGVLLPFSISCKQILLQIVKSKIKVEKSGEATIWEIYMKDKSGLAIVVLL